MGRYEAHGVPAKIELTTMCLGSSLTPQKLNRKKQFFQLVCWSIGELGLEQCIGTVEVV